MSVGLFSIEYNHIGKKEERRKKKEERREKKVNFEAYVDMRHIQNQVEETLPPIIR